jgi:hypothetical protein
MGVLGTIPLSEIKAYFDIFEVTDPDDREFFITTMQALDSVYLKHANRKQEPVKGQKPTKRKRE